MSLPCFKAYDVRGRLGVDLDEGIAFRIGRAFARVLGARRVVLGRDCRASSEALANAVAAGLMAEGCHVLDLGLCGTEEVYFATDHLGADGGIEVTASHNPMDYNGMKMVRAGSAPVGWETGLAAMAQLAGADDFGAAGQGSREAVDCRAAYVERVLGFVDV
ncbi:MAG: phosphomannomutase, partial [Paracoccaceae bacterium]